jgi:hypothetical protein
MTYFLAFLSGTELIELEHLTGLCTGTRARIEVKVEECLHPLDL